MLTRRGLGEQVPPEVLFLRSHYFHEGLCCLIFLSEDGILKALSDSGFSLCLLTVSANFLLGFAFAAAGMEEEKLTFGLCSSTLCACLPLGTEAGMTNGSQHSFPQFLSAAA